MSCVARREGTRRQTTLYFASQRAVVAASGKALLSPVEEAAEEGQDGGDRMHPFEHSRRCLAFSLPLNYVHLNPSNNGGKEPSGSGGGGGSGSDWEDYGGFDQLD